MLPSIVEVIEKERDDVGGYHFVGWNARNLVRALLRIQELNTITIKRLCDCTIVVLAFGQLRKFNQGNAKMYPTHRGSELPLLLSAGAFDDFRGVIERWRLTAGWLGPLDHCDGQH